MRLFVKISLTILVVTFSPPLHAQSTKTFDPFDEQGAMFTASVGTMLWLGAAQGVVEACNGDVSSIGKKLVSFVDAAEASQGQAFGKMLAGIFGEGLVLGRGVGCSGEKYRLYEGWADLTFAPLMVYFYMNP